MAYVAVKGGEQAIEESLRRLKYERVKKGAGAGVDQIEQGMRLLVDQVMSEGSLYAPSLAALAIKQGEGSMEEAVFLLRSYRSTLPRRYYSHIIDSREMEVERRISAAFKDIPQAVTALGYASLRGYGVVHPTVGELRVGQLPISVPDPLQPEREEDSYYIGEIKVTEVESLIPVTITDPNGEKELEFKVGYGITMGQNETKAIAMSILDTCLESEDKGFAVNDEEFVLYHIDAVEATGFISHLKLPHYVTFQSKLNSMRKTKKEQADDEKEI